MMNVTAERTQWGHPHLGGVARPAGDANSPKGAGYEDAP